MKNRECNIFRVQNLCAKHTTRARSAKSLTAGVQGPLKGPGSSGYFRSSVVVSDAFLTPIFPGRSELLLCDFSFFFFNNRFKGK